MTVTDQATQTTGLEATLADVVFADEQWLQAELEAIIAANSPTLPNQKKQEGAHDHTLGTSQQSASHPDEARASCRLDTTREIRRLRRRLRSLTGHATAGSAWLGRSPTEPTLKGHGLQRPMNSPSQDCPVNGTSLSPTA
jgi:hypothetical protein